MKLTALCTLSLMLLVTIAIEKPLTWEKIALIGIFGAMIYWLMRRTGA